MFDVFAFVTRRGTVLSPATRVLVRLLEDERGRWEAPCRLLVMTADTVTVAEEEYLQILSWLHEAGLPMTAANVARAMQLSAPTVHEMIGRLERDGYITRAADKAIAFTPTGQDNAETIVSRHRLIERFLTDVLGIPWDEVHEEAERLEHAMSPVLEERMLRRDRQRQDVPARPPDPGRARGSRASRWPTSRSAPTVQVLRFENEAEDLLHYLREPGSTRARRASSSPTTTRRSPSRPPASATRVTQSVAETVSVLADPSPPPRTALPEQLVLGKDRYGR